MEKVYSYKNEKDLNRYQDANAFLVETNYSCFMQYPYKGDALKSIIEKLHKLNKKVYLRCERILLENEANELIKDKELFLTADGIFFEDFSYLIIFASRRPGFKLVYFPYEGISSLEEVDVILKNGVDDVIIPRGKENLLNENKIYKHVGISYVYREILFTSRRKLLSLKDIVNKGEHQLKEKTRDSLQYIKETSVGTFIYGDIKSLENSNYQAEILLYDYLLIEN